MELTNQNLIFCTKCGSKNETTSKFCNTCGNVLRRHEIESNDLEIGSNTSSYTDNGYTQDEMELFISKKQEFYLTKFKVITTTGDKKSWNWSAFLLTIPWMVYRKMYLEALILYSANLILSFIPFIGSMLSLLIWIALGMFGNSLYLNYINRRFKQINSADSTLRQILINKYGGTNKLLAIVISIVQCLIAMIFMSIWFMLTA